MNINNLTSQDIYFGPLHLPPNATAFYVDDTTATSLYLTSDLVADAINNAAATNKIAVSGQAQPFPRPTGVPQLLHGDGSPEGVVFAPQGSLFLRRDNSGAANAIYSKTTGVTLSTGWQAGNIGNAFVATTMSALGTPSLDGTNGLLVAGTSPYDLIPFVWSATYSKWISAPFPGPYVSLSGVGNSWTSGMVGGPLQLKYGRFGAAGVKLQGQFIGWMQDTSNSQGNAYSRWSVGHSPSYPVEQNLATITLLNGNALQYNGTIDGSSDWLDLAVVSDAYITVNWQFEDAAGHTANVGGHTYFRYTS